MWSDVKCPKISNESLFLVDEDSKERVSDSDKGDLIIKASCFCSLINNYKAIRMNGVMMTMMMTTTMNGIKLGEIRADGWRDARLVAVISKWAEATPCW